MRLLSVFGTRPEAIKMAPILLALKQEPSVESLICVTGQHREMLSPVLDLFGIVPDRDLRLMEKAQSLNVLLARAIRDIDRMIADLEPDCVMVQGDTTSALAGAQAAFHRGIPVAHVEAGLRTGSLKQPWPEEANRRQIDLISDLLFAPTAGAKANLLRESVEGTIFVTGNSGIDALGIATRRLADDAGLAAEADAGLPRLEDDRKLLLVTGHRRESHGRGIRNMCRALKRLAERPDLDIVFPAHLNPDVQQTVCEELHGRANIHLLPPLPLLPFIRLMQKASVVLTDSGGVQEEATALGKPVLVMRERSDRPESLEVRAARLVGTSAARIVREAEVLLEAAAVPHIALAANPYGDGRASGRIVDGLLGRPVDEFGRAGEEDVPVANFG